MHILLRIASVFSLLASLVGSAHAQPAPPATGVRVQVYGIHYGGNIVYNYKVTNSSNKSLHDLIIGSEFRSAEDSEYPQLLRLPLGWQYGEGGETGPEIILAPSSTSQPPNWKASVYGQQETALFYLQWDSYSGDKSSEIQPGQTLAGFSVTVPLVHTTRHPPHYSLTAPDEMYLKGGFKVNFISEKQFDEGWGKLELIDNAPPSLTVGISPDILWPPNGKFVPVTATIVVNDDYDPAPEIQLVSITSNESASADDALDVQPGTDDRSFSLAAKRAGNNMAGRIYTITYSATDGSGNKATASATVTVPHDQGK